MDRSSRRIVTFIAVEAIGTLLEMQEAAQKAAGQVVRSGLGGFLYLNVLDASFSFDGVIGAFALSNNMVVIALGLITVGLLSSTFHLGHPERAWRAFSQWRSSWLSREGVAAVITYVPAVIFGAVSSFHLAHGPGLAPSSTLKYANVTSWVTPSGYCMVTMWRLSSG